MVYLEYNILGKNKQIKIDEIDHRDDENVFKRDEKHYEYNVGKKEQNTFKKLLHILKLWNEFTEQNRIDYWACGGTLLGAVRHSGFIPWDNDIDVCIMLSDLKKVKRKLDGHPVLRYYECECGLRIYIKNKNDKNKNDKNKNDKNKNDKNNGLDDNAETFPFMDIFICDYYNKITVKFCGFLSSNGDPTWFMSDLFPNQHIYSSELYPLKQVVFENVTIMVPNNQINLLFRNFSDKCLTMCKISNHIGLHEGIFNNKNIQEGHYNFSKNLYSIEKIFNISRESTLNTYKYKLIKNAISSESIIKLFDNALVKKILN